MSNCCSNCDISKICLDSTEQDGLEICPVTQSRFDVILKDILKKLVKKME